VSPVYKLSNNSVKNGKTLYGSMLAGNTAYELPGDYESIATTLLNGNQNTITFDNIASTYKHLQFRILGRCTAASPTENIYLRFNNVSSGSLYATHQLAGGGTDASASAQSSADETYQALITASSASANIFGVSVIDILDYKDTNKFKTIKTLSGADTNGGGFALQRSGLWRSTNAITRIDCFASGAINLVANTHIALYGIRG